MAVNRFQPPVTTTDPKPAFDQLGRVLDAIAPLPPFQVETGAKLSVAAGDFRRLCPRAAGMDVLIPAANGSNHGLRIVLIVEAGRGVCRVRASSGTINGATAFTLAAGYTTVIELFSNGSGAWMVQNAAGTGQLPIIQPGSSIGLQITAAGAVTAIEITGANAGENLRLSTWVRDAATAGNTVDYAFALGKTGFRFTNATPPNLQGIAYAASGGTGRPVFVTAGVGKTLTLSDNDAAEGTATRRINTPGSIPLTLLGNEFATLLDDTDATRISVVALARARSAVQANGGTISPAETLNHVNGIGTTATCPVAAGVAAPQIDVNFATQTTLDLGASAVLALTPALIGFRPGVAGITTNPTTTNAVTNLSTGVYSIRAGSMIPGALYRLTTLWVAALTLAGPTLTIELLTGGTVRRTLVIPAAAAASTYTGKMVAYVRCVTNGATGSLMLSYEHIDNSQAFGLNSVQNDTTTAVLAAVDTTVAQTIELRMRMTTAVAANTLTLTQAFIERVQ